THACGVSSVVYHGSDGCCIQPFTLRHPEVKPSSATKSSMVLTSRHRCSMRVVMKSIRT
ncbi:hypothetical protein TNCV_2771491, partial [Trichonephila clavipes]